MKTLKNINQLSLFDDYQIIEVPKKSIIQNEKIVSDDSKKEGKVVSLMEFEYKKAEEKLNSYSAHLI
jgi:hypothetical protein